MSDEHDTPEPFSALVRGFRCSLLPGLVRGVLRGVLPGLFLVPVFACVSPKPLLVTAPAAVVAGGSRAREVPKARISFYADFWYALRELSLQDAWIIADSKDERSLADAMEAFFEGRNTEADSIAMQLLSSRDREVRDAARVTHGAILTSEGNWTRLATYADSAGRENRDAAGVETWAPAFKGVATSISFGDSVTSLPLTRSMTGVAIIPVTINGVKRHFWLDTGSSITILTESVALDARITGFGRDTLELVSSVGRLSTRAAVVKSLKLGTFTVSNAPAMIVRDEALQVREASSGMPPLPIDGVIGFDLIRKLDVTIDDAASRVILRKPVVVTGKLAARNLFWFGVPIVTLLAEDGTLVHMLLDTGAEETFGTASLATKSDAHWRAAERRTVRGFGGVKTESGLVIPSVHLFLGNVSLSFQRIFLYDANYPTIFNLDGTLGSDAGRGGTLRIDMTNGRLEVSGG